MQTKISYPIEDNPNYRALVRAGVNHPVDRLQYWVDRLNKMNREKILPLLHHWRQAYNKSDSALRTYPEGSPLYKRADKTFNVASIRLDATILCKHSF